MYWAFSVRKAAMMSHPKRNRWLRLPAMFNVLHRVFFNPPGVPSNMRADRFFFPLTRLFPRFAERPLRDGRGAAGTPAVTRRVMMSTALGGAVCLTAARPALAGDTPPDAVLRCARAVAARLDAATRAAFLQRAAEAGWTSSGLPVLSRLQPQIATEFRSGATLLVDGMRLSETEVTWYVACAARETHT